MMDDAVRLLHVENCRPGQCASISRLASALGVEDGFRCDREKPRFRSSGFDDRCGQFGEIGVHFVGCNHHRCSVTGQLADRNRRRANFLEFEPAEDIQALECWLNRESDREKK